MPVGSLVSYLASGALDDVLDQVSSAEDIRDAIKDVVESYNQGGLGSAAKTSAGHAASFLSDDIIDPEDIKRFLQNRSLADMAMNMNLSRLLAVAAASSVGGPLGYLASKAMKKHVPKVTGNDIVRAYKKKFSRPTPPPEESVDDEDDVLEDSPPDTASPGNGRVVPPAGPMPVQGDLSGVTQLPENADPSEIAAELERQQQEARIANQIQQAGQNIPDSTPPVQQLPGQIPADQIGGEPTEGGGESGDQQPVDDQSRAAELDREKHEAALGAEAAAEEGQEEEESTAENMKGKSKKNKFDPRPGSELFLTGQMLAFAFSVFTDLEALEYIHEHFFGYYLMPHIPFAQIHYGPEAKTEYDQPTSGQLVFGISIFVIEFGLIVTIPVLFITLLIIPLAPAILGATAGEAILSGISDAISASGLQGFFDSLSNLFK